MTGQRKPPLVVTIDGPAGSGKSTTAKQVAGRLGYRHLDSGALYRAITVACRRSRIPETEWEDLDEVALSGLDIELVPTRGGFLVLVDGEDPEQELRSSETTRLAPLLAKNPRVRARLSQVQRSALAFGPLVAEGRDMGTVVFPDAEVKVYLTASLEERSRRRLLQEGRGLDADSVRSEALRIRERDQTDAGREVAPLRMPPRAMAIDTTTLTLDEQVAQIVDAVTTLTDGAAEK